jgi:hypothetical protein
LTFGRQGRKNNDETPCPKKRVNVFRCTDPVADIVLCMEYVILFLRIICYCLDALRYIILCPANVWNPADWSVTYFRLFISNYRNSEQIPNKEAGFHIATCNLSIWSAKPKEPMFDYVDFQFNSIQIVALQENPFNTKGTKCITKDTKDTKNFLCRFCGSFALKISEYKNLISTIYPPCTKQFKLSHCKKIHSTQRTRSVSQRAQRISFADFAVTENLHSSLQSAPSACKRNANKCPVSFLYMIHYPVPDL